MSSSASNPTTDDLIAEIERLRAALEAVQNTPRRAGILTCQQIASHALAGGSVSLDRGEASLGNPFYYRAVRAYLEDRYRHRCAYCRVDFETLQIDHVTPVSRGGSDAIGNLVLACVPCNKSKGTQTAAEFGFDTVALVAASQVLPKWKVR
jgi:5-methylcytosine-specific restriction endonuclease McrA